MNYTNDARGSIAIPFAISLTGLAAAGFAAINLGNINSLKETAQSTVDSAALAIASGTETKNYQKLAQSYITQNFNSGEFQNTSVYTNFDASNNVWTVKMSGKIKNSMGSLLGDSTITATASATADQPQKLSDMSFTPGNTSGWFDKTVTLFGINARTQQTDRFWNLSYRYNRGSPSVNMSNSNIKVSGYSSLYLRMDIDPNSYGFAGNGSYTTNSTNSSARINYIMIGGQVLTAPLISSQQ